MEAEVVALAELEEPPVVEIGVGVRTPIDTSPVLVAMVFGLSITKWLV